MFANMISRVSIENYKSIETASFKTRRVNVFIGEPNSGKSNLLEAVGLLSREVSIRLREVCRISQTAEIFFDRNVEHDVRVVTFPDRELKIKRENGQFACSVTQPGGGTIGHFVFDENGGSGGGSGWAPDIRYYRYRAMNRAEYDRSPSGHLLPPYGSNLPNLLYTNKAVRDSISAFFKSKGFRLELRPQDNEILMSKEVDDILYSFPFESISETMKRIVFYKAALESNKDAVLVFDEPESNTFPFYTKYLAERIALDTTNQFFLTTHNPYVLMSIIEKTPEAELAVFVTRMKNYRTELHQMTPEELAEALELSMDLFLNLDRYFPE